jgi:hypothetical protein
MGSFKSPAAQARDGQTTLSGPPLGDDEWVRIWAVLPHSVSARITSEATKAVVDPRTSRVTATFDAGIATMAKVRYGIVDWRMLDEDGKEVPWQGEIAYGLIDGLNDDVFKFIGQAIDNGSPADLASPVNPEDKDSERLGEGFGGTSGPSSTVVSLPPSLERTESLNG